MCGCILLSQTRFKLSDSQVSKVVVQIEMNHVQKKTYRGATKTHIKKKNYNHRSWDVTLAMHLWRERSCSRVGSSSIATVPSLNVPSGEGEPAISLQVLPKNRWTPSIPLVFQVFESLEAQ